MSETKKFWIRFSSWLTVAYIFPALFLIFRFDLFSQTTKLKVGGWGVVFIIFTYIFFKYIINTIRKGMPEGVTKQTLDGVSRVTLPLVVIAFITYWLSNLIDELLQFEIILIICETSAFAINPFPKWKKDNKIEDEAMSFDKFLKMLKKDKKQEA